ncbi:MAG: preprotein translocase subunit SecY [Anaerolineales bacterium]|nr:preprotein translocase subunit SecY [Anaerolineales bacterium]MCB0016513.1 preprotein translocase subunit SecY [Anaerolineales bacterium]MCB0029153.1 preprotein translocase subunit SecY [Anaerolineales bacterium]
MIESIRTAFSLPDLRRRILFTVGVLVLYRLVANIAVPGVNLDAWEAFRQQSSAAGGGLGSLIGVLDLLSGGAVRNFSVMAMGVYPYITASIIIQLLTPIIPQLEELQQEGESGRNKMTKITYYLAVPLAFVQAYGQIRLVGFSIGGGITAIMPNFGFSPPENILPTLTTLIAMVGGTMFAIWLGEQITESGIGQGVSLIIFSGIVAGVPTQLTRIAQLDDATAKWFIAISGVVLTVLTILVIVVVQEGQRRIPVQYGRRVRGRKVYQGQSTHVPLKVNTAGMIPIIFAQSIITFPGLIAQFFLPSDGSLVTADSPIIQRIANSIFNAFGTGTGFWYWFFYFLLVFAFTFFYTDVMVRQQRLPETLQRNGGFIPGIRPGRKTEEYIMAVVRRITLVGALFLAVVAILPGPMGYLGNLLNIQNLELSALVISGSGLIIVVGVVIDTMRQLEAQLLMRHYEGFIG